MKSKVVGLCISSAVGWSLGIQFEKWRTSTVRAKTLIEDQADSAPILPPNRIGQIARYGFPGTGNVRALDDFLLSYDFRNRIAYWTLEHLTYDRLHPNYKVDRSKCEFVQDESIHALFRSTNDDFKRSGYDRGHLAAAGNHRMSQKHVEQTFFLSNIAPQIVVLFPKRLVTPSLDKCKTLHIEKGVLKKEDFALGNGDVIESIEEGKFYKYLGFQRDPNIIIICCKYHAQLILLPNSIPD